VPVAFARSVLYWLKDYQSLIADCEDYETANGAEHKRPVVSSFVASGSAAAEGSTLPDSTASLVAFNSAQDFPQAPTYAAMLIGSLQLLQDTKGQEFASGSGSGWNALNGEPAPFQNIGSIAAGAPLTSILAKAGAEAVGRQLAVAASSALYAGATAGQQIALGAVTVANVAKMFAGLDPAHLASGAKLYVSPGDYALLIASDPTGLSRLPVPVVPSNSCTNWVTGTVSGPVLANLGNWLTFRHAGSVGVQVLSERYAEMLQFGLRVHVRGSFLTTGAVSSAVYAK
jgi:hypothetical protein